MRKQQFTIRTLMFTTFLVAVLLTFAIPHYDDAVEFFFPPPKPVSTQMTEAQIIRQLLRRVPAGSAQEITIRPLGDSKIEVATPD